MKKYRNHSNYVRKDEEMERNDEASLTIPDQSMSLAELLQRYTRGGSIETLAGQYENETGEPWDFDDNHQDYEKLRPVEKLQLASEIRQAIREHQMSGPVEKPVPPAPAPDPAPAPVPAPSPTPSNTDK